MPATPVWLAAIENVLNRGIGQSAKASAAAARLDRTSMALDIEGVLRIRAAVAGGRLSLTSGGGAGDSGGASGGGVGGGAGDGAEAADAVIAGSPLALFELFAGRRGGAAGAGKPVRISGDADVAARYRELLALARPDWEEELARLIGDLPARRLSMAAQATLGWLRSVGRTAGQNLAEYLQEESRDVVSKPELEEFLAGVDRVRETADRVQARLARLEQRLKGPA
jgi:ubiquinone biosynthesis protein UbiJ